MEKDLGPGKRARLRSVLLHIAVSRLPGAKPKRRRDKGDGGAPVPVDPSRPRAGEGGGAAALEFDL